MKYLRFIISAFVLFSCSEPMENEFKEANDNMVAEKLIKRYEILHKDGINENVIYTLNYDAENRLSSITDGNWTEFFNYDGSSISSMTGEGASVFAEEIFQDAPYDVFEDGDVLEFDENQNPSKIEIYNGGYQVKTQIGEILYDPNPSPFFFTLKAAGLIDAMDNINLNVGYQSPELIKARILLPYNNIKGIIVKDLQGITQFETQIDYTYDEDNYPSSGIVTVLLPDGSYTYELRYYYK